LLVAAIVLANVTAARALAKDNWIDVQSTNFHLISNAGEGETCKLALKLEQFRYAFTQLSSIEAAASEPVTVVVFKDEASFRPYKPLYNGKPTNIAGYFHRDQDQNLVSLNINGNQLHPLAVIFHEYVHVLTGSLQQPLPTWFYEGLAEVYSTFESRDQEVDLGMPVKEHVNLLRANALIPLHTLFDINTKSPEYNEGAKQGIFYAESWALVHYLAIGDNRSHMPQLVEFVKLCASGIDPKNAFSSVFGSDFSVIEAALRAYVRRSSLSYLTITLNNPMRQGDITVRPLADSDLRFYQGLLFLHTDRPDEAVALFKQAAALDPSSPRPYEGLGIAAFQRRDYKEAVTRLEEAIAHDSKSDLAHYYYAESLWRSGASDGSHLGPDVSPLVIHELKEAIKLGPSLAKAYYLLGQAYLFTGDHIEEGADAERTAIKLDPEHWRNFSLALGELQIRLAKYDEARRTLQPLLGSDTDADIREPARQIMKMLEVYSTAAQRKPKESGESQNSGPGSLLIQDRPGDAPTLGRRTETGAKGQGQGNAPHPPSETDDSSKESATQTSSAQDSRFEGTQPMAGVLVAIECTGKGVAIVLRTDDNKIVRFSTSDPTKLRFYSKTPSTGKITCGALKRPGVVHFKPVTGRAPDTPGEAFSIEFKD
ncbi:MAG TPA: tetratricopeptide repeat protein, partial [Blastocatellia bacterium]